MPAGPILLKAAAGDQKDDWLAVRTEDPDHGDIGGICAAARACGIAGQRKTGGAGAPICPRMGCRPERQRQPAGRAGAAGPTGWCFGPRARLCAATGRAGTGPR